MENTTTTPPLHMTDTTTEFSFSTTSHLIAGGVAGFAEHALTYPIDVVKTRMQGVVHALRTIVRTERITGIYRGLSAVLGGAIPSHALYFATYEYAKRFLSSQNAPTNFQIAISGALATCAHDLVATPIDVIKQRMQIHGSKFRRISECIIGVYRREGFRAFFISYPTTVLMNIPYTSIHFITYETCKHILRDKSGKFEEAHQPWKHIVAGAIAGATGAAFSNPFDVVKTTLQTQGHFGTRYRGLIDAMIHIYKLSGWRGFLKGITPRMLFCAPSAAITWTSYEYVKYLLRTS